MKSDRSNPTHRRQRGFSLVELTIVMASLSVILAMLGQIVFRVQKDYLEQRQLMEAKHNARVTMDTIIRLVRMAGYDPQDIITQPIVDADPDGNAQWDSIHLRIPSRMFGSLLKVGACSRKSQVTQQGVSSSSKASNP